MFLRTHVAAAILLGAGLQPPAAAVVVNEPASAQPVCAPSRSIASVASTTTSEDAARVIRDFVGAYNDGDIDRLDELFAPEPDFEWYTVSRGAREEITAYDRGALPPYFSRRHRAGDHLKLLDLVVSEERGWHGGFDFSFRLVRSSDQRRAEGWYHGKGAADCRIFVWSMGRET
ncbi:MAG: nuclear transport factor 2 family protein [Actinomycetota bacterium]